MAFGSSVAARTRLRRAGVGVAATWHSGGMEKKKGVFIQSESEVKETSTSKKPRQCTGVAGLEDRGKSPQIAQSPGGDNQDQIIYIGESDMDSLDESDNELVEGSRGECSHSVRAQLHSSEFWPPVATRTRSRRGVIAKWSDLGGMDKRKGDSFLSHQVARRCSSYDSDEDVIRIRDSVSDSFVDAAEYSPDETNDSLVRGSRGESSQFVRAERDIETTPNECARDKADSMIFLSDSSDEEVAPCEDGEKRLPDTDSGFEESESSGESESDESDDEDFSPCGDQEEMEVEVDEEEVAGDDDQGEKEEEEEEEKEAEQTTVLPSNGLFSDLKVEQDQQDASDMKIINIGSSDDDTHDNTGMSGGVSRRTRAKLGPKGNRRETILGLSSPRTIGGRLIMKRKHGSPLRKKARNEYERKQLQDAKNNVEKGTTMLSSSMGHMGKQNTMADICKPEKSKDGNDKISKLHSSDNGSSTSTGKVERKAATKRDRKSDFFEILIDSILMKNGLQDEVQEEAKKLLSPNFSWFGFYEEPEKSNGEEEMDNLWRMLNLGIQAQMIGSFDSRNEDQETETAELPIVQAGCRCGGKHDLFLDEQIGMRCRNCGHIEFEIDDYCPPFEKLQTTYRSYHRYQGSATLDAFNIQPSKSFQVDRSSHVLNGTVWDLIPDVRNQLYPHQREGFEFLWRNIGGSISLDDLRSMCPQKLGDTGGCIISHAPGTGKTRLTLVFLQSYLEQYPDSRPVIVAPAGLLLTWESEFKKWGIEVPFFNLNTKLLGQEDTGAVRMLDCHRLSRNKNGIRMVKLYSWCKEKSILLLSYELFVKLTGESSKKEIQHMREILIRQPGLVILDEGHIPRNRESQIWNLMIKLETKKRVILSGTPFQNNFEEFLNTLHLVRPKIAESIPRTLKKFCHKGPSVHSDGSSVKAIDNIKAIMDPFVHLHKGSVLQESLPGLKECVVVLNPNELQLEVLRGFQRSENEALYVRKKRKDLSVFDFEHKQALISVHPSLALGLNLSSEEKPLILKDDEMLKAHELNPIKGVKTWFLKEFIQLCLTMGEKVLVFSQYIKPLELIAEQLSKTFNWNKGTEILIMVGELRMNQRQSMITEFNNPKSPTKVLLASTKACSEGISLVGASRVILLDVVWNPAVERQAISRAYRLGQQRVVHTYHLIMKGTTEWEKYQKQVQKNRLSELVFSSSSSNGDIRGKKLAAVSEDKILEEMTSHPKLRGLFYQIRYQPRRLDTVEHFAPTLEST
ncbi:hypothetical protein SAY86_020515 [Trapa natans]|uniref:Uncharacterized protein n=1 Tax=Trapa natans TaxID=22666 RepID=A0AAN7R6L2_TRANT|nr:hypothetical protein SAY86_020515 [Trapa natans]